MGPLALLMSPAGRLAAPAFVTGVIVVFAFGCFALMLISVSLPASIGLPLFAIAQAITTWCWFCLHAKRMRDAGLAAGSAIGIAALYGLAMCLLVLVLLSMPLAGDGPGGSAALVVLFERFARAPELEFFDYVISAMLLLVMLPVVIALGFSIWLANQPSVQEKSP